MTKTNTWMPLYIADYERKTKRLSLAEDGAYMRLLRDYWMNGPPPDDDERLAIIVRVSVRDWRKLRPHIQPFFVIVHGEWRQARADEEIKKALRLSEARREAGGKGGRPKKQSESKDKPIGYQDQNQNGLQNETPARVAPPSPLPLPSEVNSDPDGSAHEEPDPDKQAWALAKRVLTKQGGLTDRQAGAFFGGLLKRFNLRPSEMLVPLMHAEDCGTLEPQPYLTQAAQNLKTLRLVHDRSSPDAKSSAFADKLSDVSDAMQAAARGG